MDREAVLEMCGVSKRFGRRLVLDRLDLEVRRGDVYGFLGPNGAGKTTAIRIATGLLRPTAGHVLLFGRDVRRHPTLRARLGAVVEIPAFYSHLSGSENLRLLANLAGIDPGEPVREALRTVELEEAAPRRVGTYSQGMRQRLGLAQALLGWPDLVVLDEPTNGLDPRGVREIRRLILRVNAERGTTFLISSHLLYEVELLCDRLSILDEGRLVEQGSTAELLAPEPDYYRLEVDAPDQAVAELRAADLDAEAGEDGRVVLRAPATAVAEANALLVGAGLRVTEIVPVRPTLEDHFLRRTGGGADAR
jgi:ABC-2 type transport system ATP-binding protein